MIKLDINELKKRFQARSVLALTMESDRLLVGLLHRDDAGIRLEKSLSLDLGAAAIVANPQKAGEKLAAELEREEIRERRCVVCLPTHWALATSTELPPVDADDLRGYLELCAERELPVSDLRLAHSSYALSDGIPRATLAGVPAKRIEAVEAALMAAGCKIVSMSLGLDRYLPAASAHGALFFLTNGSHVDLVVAGGGGIAAVRSLEGAADSETPLEAGAFCREVRITLGRLPQSLREQIRRARFEGSSKAEALLRESRVQLGRLGLEHVDISRENNPPALEAAERHLRREPIAFEYVVPRVNRAEVLLKRFDSRQRRWLGGAVVALILLPLLLAIVRSRIESHYSSQWEAMRKNVTELDSIQGNLRQYRPWFEPAPQNLQLFDALISGFPEAGDVWAKSVQMTGEFQVTCSGFARNQPALMGLLDRLRARPDVVGLQVQQVRGDNPVQFSVTYKWEANRAE